MQFQSLILIVSLTATHGWAQLNPIKQAQKKIQQKHWKEARALLNKAHKKDSLEVAVYFSYSKLFLNPLYPDAHIDSGYAFAHGAQRLWNHSSTREKDRALKHGIDSATLQNWMTTIDSIAFEKAKQTDTESAYQHFLNVYSNSSQRGLATELRDEAAFSDALKQNTHGAFQNFLTKYPNSHRNHEAQKRYNYLWYTHATRHKTQHEYETFLINYPQSPHTGEALQKVFELALLDGQPSSFKQFIQAYPNTQQAKRALAILAHLIPDKERLTIFDSLKAVYPTTLWLPIHQEHGWGYIDLNGKVKATGMPEPLEAYMCNPLKTDYINTTEGIIFRNGHMLLAGAIHKVLDVGAGFLWVESAEGGRVIHKSSALGAIHPAQEASVLHNRFIAARQQNWTLFSLTGQALTQSAFESIEQLGQHALFKRAGKSLLVPVDMILPFARGEYQPIAADDIKTMGKFYWMRNGFLEQVLDSTLKPVIPYNRHEISYGPLGIMVKQGNQAMLPHWITNNQSFERIVIAKPWAILHGHGQKTSLHHIPSKRIIDSAADSIWFEQNMVFTRMRDSILIRLPNLQTINIGSSEDVQVRVAKDSSIFLLIKVKNKTRVIEAKTFREFFRTEFMVQPLLHNIFLFENKGKKGLLNQTGKIILPAEYDGILFGANTLSLLKGNLFGVFSLKTKKVIKPIYETNLRSLGNNHFAVRKKNGWGFLTTDGKAISKFTYDDIQPWSDSVAIVDSNGFKSIVNINQQKMLIDSLSNLVPFETEAGNHGLVERNGQYGLINAHGKIILMPQEEELVIIDTDEEKLLMTITAKSNHKKLISYRKLNGALIYSFETTNDIALKLLCD